MGTERDACFELTTRWLTVEDEVEDEEEEDEVEKRRNRSAGSLPQRRLGAQLVGLFAEAEAGEFERRICKVLPVLPKMISPDKFEDDEEEEGLEEEEEEMEEVVDDDGWTTM